VVSLAESPVDAAFTEDASPPWTAEWTVNVRETAGIGGAIDLVQATLSDSNGEPIAETELDAAQVAEQLGGSNRIAAGGNVAIAMSLGFAFPEDTFSASLEVTVELSDDRGNPVSGVVDDVIQVCVPRLLSPPDGAELDNGCTDRTNGILWEFGWTACEEAEAYEIYIKQGNAQEPLVDRRGLTDTTYSVIENAVIYEEARFGWIWKVRAKINGSWADWSPERTFDVEPLNTDCQ